MNMVYLFFNPQLPAQWQIVNDNGYHQQQGQGDQET